MIDRPAILATITKHLRLNVEGVDEQAIDTSRSMIDLGATSLDVVEVVMASMQELKLKVPRSRLAGLRNIDELADLFYEVQSAG
jgi:polyketide biosynthesis acyl carrier protein